VYEYGNRSLEAIIGDFKARRDLLPTQTCGAFHERGSKGLMRGVVSAIYKGDYRIEVTFEDGKKGIVDFAKYLDKGGVFERFEYKNFFGRFHINQELGTLSWQDEIDVAPESLYAEATGSSLPEWMEQ
jgi:Protein of unknown function (DUF2442)